MENPIKPNFKTEILSIFFILISIIFSFYFYSEFPNRVVTHWNFLGEADGWSSKGFAAFFFPGLIIFIYLLLLLVPITDPKKDRYDEFRGVYHKFKTLIIVFFAIIYFIASLKNIGFDFNIGIAISSLVGLLFLIIGNYLGKVKRNWFLGVRTPWTLTSDVVWNKTNRLGGKIFILMGVLMIISGIFPNKFILLSSISIFIMLILYLFAYSYFLYAKEQKNDSTVAENDKDKTS